MAQKLINLSEIGIVKLQKRRGAKSIRLTVGHDSVIRVSMPVWTPYKAGEMFALSKKDWVLEQLETKQSHVILHNHRIGKNHRVKFVFIESGNITCRVAETSVIVRLPKTKNIADKDVQKKLRAGAVRALKQEANNLLPQKLDMLAQKHGLQYKSVNIKQLKTRWGSCSSNSDIALNCFLMQLPWELIEYVLLHELVHTRVMAHGSKFWNELAKYVADLPDKRKSIKQHQPILESQD